MSRASGGAFDVTVGPVVGLWRRARRTGRLPRTAELAAAQRLTGWRKVLLDPRRRSVKLLAAGMRLDLGGIAKGYAADEALAAVARAGVRRAMVEAGGDLVVGGAPPGRRGWRIGLDHPAPGMPRELWLAGCALSTSGSSEQYVAIDGRRYSHIVDPRTGLALTTSGEATVRAPRGRIADALATAAVVLGARRSGRMLRRWPGTRVWLRDAAPARAPGPPDARTPAGGSVSPGR
jgi:thiamine biosynthesis lipoprotein